MFSAAIRAAPSSRTVKLSVLAAPISCAAALAVSASASAASLCGIVTLTPAYSPSSASSATPASKSSGGRSSAP